MKKYYLLFLCVILTLINAVLSSSDAAEYVGGQNELMNAINSVGTTDLVRNFTQNQNFTLSVTPPAIATAGSTLSISGNNFSIDGNNNYGFSVASGQTLNISNAGSLDSSGAVVNAIKNFYRPTPGAYSGSGVIYNSGSLNISNSVFTNNSSTNGSYALGGVLWNAFAGGTNITKIDNSTFISNHATWGGVIANYFGSTTEIITNSTFKDNYATTYGGVIYNYGYSGGTVKLTIDNSSFIHNYISGTSGNGGVIYNRLATVDIINSYFTKNTAKYGACLYSLTGAATINNSTFIDNTANNYYSALAGAVANYSSSANATEMDSTLTITNSTFTNNTATSTAVSALTATAYGGAVGNTSSATSTGIAKAILTIENSSFSGNKALSSASGDLTTTMSKALGGAICNSVAESSTGPAITTMNISNSTFTNNSAVATGTVSPSYVYGYGGAVYNIGGTLNVLNSSFTNNSASTEGGAIYSKTGTLNIVANNGITSFSGNKANGISEAVYLDVNSKMNLNAGNNGSVIFNDKISSVATANPININKVGDGATGNPALNAPTNGNVTFNNTVSNSTINFYNGTMTLGRENFINTNDLNLYGGTVNLINNSIGTMNVNNLSLKGNSNIGIDADLANGIADKITSVNPVTTSTGLEKINISKVNIMSDTSKESINLAVADASTRDYLQLGTTRAETPLYKYNLVYNASSGSINFVNTGFTPSAIATPIASSAGVYTTQANVYREAFGNLDQLMFMPASERLLMKNQNKVATAEDNFVFSPTFLPESSAGIWVKQFTTFENIPLRNGPNVSNVGYGLLAGGDSDMVELRHGYSGYLSAYVGYNGSHQNYDSVGIYQNGGLFGLTGTVYKGDFFASLTANVGATAGTSYTSYGTDNFTTLTSGLAAKTGYNFEFFNGKFIVQPSYMMTYTFADTFNYTTASGLNITSDPLNAIQIIPGIKFISNLKNGWQPYIGLNMIWNIMDATKFYANNVELPQFSIDPYVEYGVGVQRKWAERFTGYMQAMARGGGRNGIALQFGLRWAI